ncbi:hypothetical protein MVEN_02304300 [Mycena venus]|uniref:Uncharacterized protein n=1 Tax=Mycena venus TaxID=2733690 RepID=A0A8H6X4G6_9AGAR|nr:hypothetical protein MVEN_02304300 [Mycena venus]
MREIGPVLIVEIKPPGNLRLPSAREEADIQIRRAFGTRLAFYKMAKGHQIVPDRILPDPTLLTDTGPLL